MQSIHCIFRQKTVRCSFFQGFRVLFCTISPSLWQGSGSPLSGNMDNCQPHSASADGEHRNTSGQHRSTSRDVLESARGRTRVLPWTNSSSLPGALQSAHGRTRVRRRCTVSGTGARALRAEKLQKNSQSLQPETVCGDWLNWFSPHGERRYLVFTLRAWR